MGLLHDPALRQRLTYTSAELEERGSDHATDGTRVAVIAVVSIGVVAAASLAACTVWPERRSRPTSVNTSSPVGPPLELSTLPPASLPCNHSQADSTVFQPESADRESRANGIKTTEGFETPRSDSDTELRVPAAKIRECV